MVNLLSVCGQKVGLPKSPSVSTGSSSPDKTPDLSPFLKIPPLCSGPGLISKGWPITFSLFTVVCMCYHGCCKDLHFNEALSGSRQFRPIVSSSPLPPICNIRMILFKQAQDLSDLIDFMPKSNLACFPCLLTVFWPGGGSEWQGTPCVLL